MNKSELINALAEKTSFSKKDAEKALNAFVETINGALAKGEKVLQGAFFQSRQGSERQG